MRAVRHFLRARPIVEAIFFFGLPPEKAMHVTKRNGQLEPVQFDKITRRISTLTFGLDKSVDAVNVAQKVIAGVYDKVHTEKLDDLASETSAYLMTTHPDYGILAGRIAFSNLHKQTMETFSDVMELLHNHVDGRTGERAPLVSESFIKIVRDNKTVLDEAVRHDRDFSFDFFAFRTLHHSSYLLKTNGKVAERPQHMFMRVAIGIHGSDIPAVMETYDCMSKKEFIHATPTLFNAGSPNGQLASCFLLTVSEDSIDGIFKTLGRCAAISKCAGGIGLSVSHIRAKGSYIKGSGGTSNGLTPMLRVYDNAARYVDQGGGKRKGSFAIYLEPWHADIEEFLDLRKNHGKEEMRARDLFYALWIPDIFMRRVEEEGAWPLFCPSECSGLVDTYGAEFEVNFLKHEASGKARRVVPAQELWMKIIASQIETGTPYMLYKDSANEKSNQKNLGCIRGSNLCTEIMEYTSPEEVAVCNLASISLPSCLSEDGSFLYSKLDRITCIITRNLNRVIDGTYYPIEQASYSNKKHRPIGIGVQGLADVFLKMDLPFDSQEARVLNLNIFEVIYYAAMRTSCELAMQCGPYESFSGSPASKGILQFDMWGITPKYYGDMWLALKEDIMKHGLRNSLLVAPMPTASTAQILGNTECFEPITNLIYSRRTLSGEFCVVNSDLVKRLQGMSLWSEDVAQSIMQHNGSIQHMMNLPEDMREVFRTTWEIKQRSIIDMAADRAPFICQSQSLNLFASEVTNAKLSSMHFYVWKKGLKGSYYLRTRAAVDAVKFTIRGNHEAKPAPPPSTNGEACTRDCLSCGA